MRLHMNKNIFYLLISWMFIGGLIGCEDKNDDHDFPTIGDEFNGVYKGKLVYRVAETTVEWKSLVQKVNVKKSKDERVDITMSNLPWKSLELSTIILREVTASQIEFQGPVTLYSNNPINKDKENEVQLELTGDLTLENIEFTALVDLVVEGVEYSYEVKFTGDRLVEDQSSDARIYKFEINHDKVINEAARIFEEEGHIKIGVAANITSEELAQLNPILTISKGCRISPTPGIPQDFNSPVKYTLISEDEIVTNSYTVTVYQRLEKVDFESWENENTQLEAVKQYQLPKKTGDYIWGSSDGLFAPFMGAPANAAQEFGVTPTLDSYKGAKAVQIKTLATAASELYNIPAITGGELYTGDFEFSLNNPLEHIRYGIPVNYQPIAIKGYYKYQPGPDYYLCMNPAKPQEVVKVKDQKDAFLIRAILYQVENRNNVGEMLTAENVWNAESIVGYGEFSHGDVVDSYTEFTLPIHILDEKEFSYLNEYRLAIILSSSANGVRFSGAPGSTLWIDELEVVSN